MPDPAVIRFPCPACKFGLSAPVSKAGAKCRCPKCKQGVEVPTPLDPALDALPAKPVLDTPKKSGDNAVPGRRRSPNPALLPEGPPVIGILLLIYGGLILFLGCAVTGYFVVLFDTTVALYPDLERHGFGHLSPRVNNIGLMHKQTVWTIVGIAVMVMGLAMAIVGLVLCVIKRQRVDAGERR